METAVRYCIRAGNGLPLGEAVTLAPGIRPLKHIKT